MKRGQDATQNQRQSKGANEFLPIVGPSIAPVSSDLVQLTPNHVAHTYLVLKMPGMKLEFARVPVIYKKLQDALWCIVPEEVVQEAVKKLGDKLVIQGQGYRLEFEKIEVSQRGRELRVRPATDLKRKPGTGKPEILKIEKR